MLKTLLKCYVLVSAKVVHFPLDQLEINNGTLALPSTNAKGKLSFLLC